MQNQTNTQREQVMELLYVGVDLGGTKVSVSLWADERKADSVRWPTDPRPEANLERIVTESRKLLAGRRATAVGVSGGGPLDPERGVILSVPNLPGWRDVPICRFLAGELSAPCGLENDANASALAEWRHGAGRGVRDLVFLTFSTGMGAGLILDGRLYRGSRRLAGEVGHQTIVPGGAPCGCGRRGCLEAYASGAGMARRLSELRRRDETLPSTAREVVERAQAGDRFSRHFLRETARYLARGMANVIWVLNPARFVLGTIATGAGDLFLVPLREELGELVWPSLLEELEVLPAALGEDLGDYAARVVAEETVRRTS